MVILLPCRPLAFFRTIKRSLAARAFARRGLQNVLCFPALKETDRLIPQYWMTRDEVTEYIARLCFLGFGCVFELVDGVKYHTLEFQLREVSP